jgi:pimeloyl-ACP methyl ester carboxylesterase
VTPTVVLLHGLARTHRSMSGLARYLERLGYPTWSRTYPSRRGSLAALAARIAERIAIELGDRPLVGVTHSMGGILARHMADRLPWRGLVMLAPPNQGSRVAATLAANPVFRWFYGPAGGELGVDAPPWPAPPAPFAVIAGTRGPSLGNAPSWLVGALRLLPPGEPNDGTLTVAETRLPGMVGFAEVPASHTFLMDHPAARALVRRFLERGDFGADYDPRHG